jgi:hypothetical protein
MCIKNLWFLFLILYIVSPNTIQSPLDMTCCVSTVSCKVGKVLFNIPHTNITVTFRYNFLLIGNNYLFTNCTV